MRQPRLLDLFSGAGGAARGYQMAGFHVTGIDIKPMPRYAGDEFIQADALEFLRDRRHEFDAIHASPPCQAHTAMKTMHNARAHVDLIPETRALLRATGRPYVIENVPGSPLIAPILLCGTMFGLGVDDAELRRHRLFESNVLMLAPNCRHGARAACLGVYGGHVRDRRRRTIGVYGNGARDSRRKFDRGIDEFTVEQAREAMQIDWMTLAEMSQAIPPAFTHWLGVILVAAIEQERAA